MTNNQIFTAGMVSGFFFGIAGISLKAAGWTFRGMTDSKPHKWHSREGRRDDQPAESKQRWSKVLQGTPDGVTPQGKD